MTKSERFNFNRLQNTRCLAASIQCAYHMGIVSNSTHYNKGIRFKWNHYSWLILSNYINDKRNTISRHNIPTLYSICAAMAYAIDCKGAPRLHHIRFLFNSNKKYVRNKMFVSLFFIKIFWIRTLNYCLYYN